MNYIRGQMRDKYGNAATYASAPPQPGFIARNWPSPYFYWRLASGPARWLCALAAKNECDDSAWNYSSAWFGDVVEKTGCRIGIEGLDMLRDMDGPCVIIANHMSTMETFLLPGIIRPKRPVTFVVKKSLVELPLFGPVMRSRDPIVVERKNPRADLATVLEEGCQRLAKGVSVIVFPQSTRSLQFSHEHFNSIGVKLARKAGVAALPLALKTDAWGIGRKVKELGRIRPDLPVRFRFGTPFRITGNGRDDHERICHFIENTLLEWQKKDGTNL